MTRPRKVDFLKNAGDFAVLVLGNLGFSTNYIMHHTRLSHCQVLYRLGKQQVKRADYRNGNSPSAAIVLSTAEREVAKRVRQKLYGRTGTASKRKAS